MDSYRSFGNSIDYFFTAQFYINMYIVTGSIPHTERPLDLESMLHIMLDTANEVTLNAVVIPRENMSTSVFT
jgi:hypothetical protein